MSLMDSILSFIGGKWFTLVLGLALICVLPFTFHNFQVVYRAGQLGAFWYIVGVFVINIISVMLCVYKFLGSLGNKGVERVQEW